jgi:hypothetical protein
MIAGMLPLAAPSEPASAKVFDWSLSGPAADLGGLPFPGSGATDASPTAGRETARGCARGLADRREMSIRGGKRADSAVVAGMTKQPPAYRALTEAAALRLDFAEGRAAFAARRTAKFVFRGPTAPLAQH